MIMARHKEKKVKEHLTRAKAKNKSAPVWTILKTKNRGLRRRGRRNWRFDKRGLRTKHKKKEQKKQKHRNPRPGKTKRKTKK